MTFVNYPAEEMNDFVFIPQEYVFTFDDPNYVRAEKILIDRENGEVRILLQGEILPIGVIPVELRCKFTENRNITLKSTCNDGTLLELKSQVIML